MEKRMVAWTEDEVTAAPDAPPQASPGGGALMESLQLSGELAAWDDY